MIEVLLSYIRDLFTLFIGIIMIVYVENGGILKRLLREWNVLHGRVVYRDKEVRPVTRKPTVVCRCDSCLQLDYANILFCLILSCA
jgi:hypothetical protein